MTRYVAEYEHDGRAWVVQFQEPDIATWGRTLGMAKRYARELLATYLEVDDLAETGAEIEDRVKLPVAVSAEIARLARMRREADALRSEVAGETRRVAAALRRAGLSTRDVGEILGISAARVAQIERESAAA
jgi:DNA-directed RNA polymerase specialized sigma subunit